MQRVSGAIRQFDFDEQVIYAGEGKHTKIPDILRECKAKKPMLVCDSIFDKLFISEYINSLPVEFVKFSAFSPNPKYEEVEQGVRLFIEENCDFILSVGGGSAIDTAKNIKLFSVLDQSKVYMEQEYKFSPVKHLAIPTTAGTGSESTRFSVCYYKAEKQSIAHDSIVPEYVILEPKLLWTLPDYQKKATVLDAMCQCIEAIWSVNTNKKCRAYAAQGLELILENIDSYLAGNTHSCEQILRAANLSGKAINISQTTAAHAMSYKLTSIYGIAHGHAAAICLPHVWEYMINNRQNLVQGATQEHLESAFELYKKIFKVQKDIQAVERFCEILNSMHLNTPQLKDEKDLDALVKSINPVRLGNNPVALSEQVIRELYSKCLCSLQ